MSRHTNIEIMSDILSNESNQSKNNSFYPIIIVVCNIVVLANTKLEVFKELGHASYWNFIVFSLVSIGWIYLMMIVTCLLGCQLREDNADCITNLIKILFYVSLFAFLWLTYYFMGEIWHEDPHHTVLFYQDYWTETTLDLSGVEKGWAYTMTEVLIRIYSFILLFITMVIFPLLSCMYCVYRGLENGGGTPLTANANAFSAQL